MVRFYVCQIRLGKFTILDVPKRWRDAVEKKLSES